MLLSPYIPPRPCLGSKGVCSLEAVVPGQLVTGTLATEILQTPLRMEADQKWIWELSDERQASLCLHGC